MTTDDASLLLAVLGGTSVLTSWVGRRTGDAARDAWLMFGVGACLLTVAAGVFLW
jgi:hypothetical protein